MLYLSAIFGVVEWVITVKYMWFLRGIMLFRVFSVALFYSSSFSNIQRDNFSEEEVSHKSDFLCHSLFHIGNLQDCKGVT